MHKSSGKVKKGFFKLLYEEIFGLRIVCESKNQAKNVLKQMERWCEKTDKQVKQMNVSLVYVGPNSLCALDKMQVWEIEEDASE